MGINIGFAPAGAHSFMVSYRNLIAVAFFFAFSFHAQSTRGPGKMVGVFADINTRAPYSKASSSGTIRPLICAWPGSGNALPIEADAGGRNAAGPDRPSY